MDREYLFNAALVAIGPPYLMTGAERDMPKAPSREKFNAHVQEYNEFAMINWRSGLLYQVSYIEWSDWFHNKNH